MNIIYNQQLMTWLLSSDSLDLSIGGPTGAAAAGMRTTMRTSLPDMSRPVKTYPFDQLQTSNKHLPEDVSSAE